MQKTAQKHTLYEKNDSTFKWQNWPFCKGHSKRVVKGGGSRSRFTENKTVLSQFTKNKIGISRFTEKKRES